MTWTGDEGCEGAVVCTERLRLGVEGGIRGLVWDSNEGGGRGGGEASLEVCIETGDCALLCDGVKGAANDWAGMLRVGGVGEDRVGDAGDSGAGRTDNDLRGCTENGMRFEGEAWFALLIRATAEGGTGVCWGCGDFTGLAGRGDVPAEDALLLLEFARRRPDALGVRWCPKVGRPGVGRRCCQKLVQNTG